VDRFRITDTGVLGGHIPTKPSTPVSSYRSRLPYRVMPHGWQPKPGADYSAQVWGRSGACYTIAPAGYGDAAVKGVTMQGPWDSVRVYNSPEREL
jgi:hypothetical protein